LLHRNQGTVPAVPIQANQATQPPIPNSLAFGAYTAPELNQPNIVPTQNDPIPPCARCWRWGCDRRCWD
jgi:hypothetical protein